MGVGLEGGGGVLVLEFCFSKGNFRSTGGASFSAVDSCFFSRSYRPGSSRLVGENKSIRYYRAVVIVLLYLFSPLVCDIYRRDHFGRRFDHLSDLTNVPVFSHVHETAFASRLVASVHVLQAILTVWLTVVHALALVGT